MSERYAAWLDRDVLSAAGPEAQSFLQGQLSQDVDPLGDGDSIWSWVLAPTGKVDALVRVMRVSPEEWLLDTDAGWGGALVDRLNRFKLRTKVTIELLPWRVLALRGPGIASAGPGLAAKPWPGQEGADLIGEDITVPDGWPVLSGDEYEARRIVAGIPRKGSELDEKTIPGETGLIDLTVSFTKGCYTGQELVARIDSRGGNVPRHLRRLRMDGPLTVGADLAHHGARVGTVTSAAAGPEGWVGLGYVKRGVDAPATLEAAGADGPVAVHVLAAGEP